MDRSISRIAFMVLMIGTALAALALVALSPFALHGVASISNENWSTLSNVGQTYGAVSALLAALALVGIAVSILMQSREVRHGRWEAGRARHFEIMRIALEDPLYRQVYSLPDISSDEARLIGYINLLLEYWAMLWEFGDMPEKRLRSNLRSVLASEAGFSYWRRFGNTRLGAAGTKRERAFHQIANEVYQEIAVSWPSRNDRDAHVDRMLSSRSQNSIVGASAVLAFIAVCVAFRRRALKSWKNVRSVSRKSE